VSAAFDCSRSSQNGPGDICTDSVLFFRIPLHPESFVEVRFELQDGSMSEWQVVSLELSKHTDPDFNGPGCSCTWYSATVAPVVVPANAKLALLE
jgi:hypothetical protein